MVSYKLYWGAFKEVGWQIFDDRVVEKLTTDNSQDPLQPRPSAFDFD